MEEANVTSAAKIGLAVEPFESSKVAYATLAPITAKAKARGRVFLRRVSGVHRQVAVHLPARPARQPGRRRPTDSRPTATTSNLGEYWAVNGCINGMGAEGSQKLRVRHGRLTPESRRRDVQRVPPEGRRDEDDHHRVWGKPVRAMADGEVLESLNSCPNNPRPWDGVEDINTFLADQQTNYWGVFTNGGAGNHFYIQHGDEVVLYAHMQKGTLTPSLLAQGSKVTAGQQLGKAGNSGNSSAPHLRIHAIQGSAPETGPLRPFALKHGWVIDNDLVLRRPRAGGGQGREGYNAAPRGCARAAKGSGL